MYNLVGLLDWDEPKQKAWETLDLPEKVDLLGALVPRVGPRTMTYVLYVEPTESRVESTNAYRTRDIAVLAAGLSLLTVIAARLIR